MNMSQVALTHEITGLSMYLNVSRLRVKTGYFTLPAGEMKGRAFFLSRLLTKLDKRIKK
jgi:hypothetical protein